MECIALHCIALNFITLRRHAHLVQRGGGGGAQVQQDRERFQDGRSLGWGAAVEYITLHCIALYCIALQCIIAHYVTTPTSVSASVAAFARFSGTESVRRMDARSAAEAGTPG